MAWLQIIVTSGVGSAFDLLAHALADEGDSFLIPAPYYSVIEADINVRCQVKCFPIQMSSEETPLCKPFRITADMLEEGLKSAQEQGHRIKGLIIINPNNPTGDVYEETEIREVIDFALKHGIHAIFDEIYALSVFNKSVRFTSVLSIESLPRPELIHFLWGFSKDFCISGYRCGVIHSHHPHLVQATQHLSYLASVPCIVQQKLKAIIDDKEWIDTVFLPTNLSRMRTCYNYCNTRLQSLGVRVHPSSATYFLWVDFSKFLEEMSAKAEIALFEKLFEKGVYMTPGTSMGYQCPGWFRVNFTQPMSSLVAAMDRLEEFLSN